MKTLNPYFSFIIIISTHFIHTQNTITHKLNTTEIVKPSILSTHPLGLLFTRLEGNFKTQPSKKIIIDFNLEVFKNITNCSCHSAK